MTDVLLTSFEQTNKNALSVDWFVSPLEYFWPDGRQLFDKVFSSSGTPTSRFDELFSPKIYEKSMQVDFRAKMMVFAFMRQDISKSYGLEIENGFIHLYRLDFASCISQWIYVIEGYCRQLFSVTAVSNVKTSQWVVPSSGSPIHDSIIQSISRCLKDYLSMILYRNEKDGSSELLSRHLLLHGNVKNKSFFSQKNCLILMFLLDALVVIEMAKNLQFPHILNENEGDIDRIDRRKYVYAKLMESDFSNDNLMRMDMMEDHL